MNARSVIVPVRSRESVAGGQFRREGNVDPDVGTGAAQSFGVLVEGGAPVAER